MDGSRTLTTRRRAGLLVGIALLTALVVLVISGLTLRAQAPLSHAAAGIVVRAAAQAGDEPGISLTKRATDGLGSDISNVCRDDAIVYLFRVANTGNVPLTGVDLLDDTGGCDAPPVRQTDDPGNNDEVLDLAPEVWVFTCDHLVTEADPDPLENLASVTAGDENGALVDAGDSISVTMSQCGTMAVEKRSEPAETDQAFTFEGDAADTIWNGGRIEVARVRPGIYTSTEVSPACEVPAIECPAGDCAGCSPQPLPNLVRLGSGTTLLAGQTYLVQGPTTAITARFSTRLWMAAYKPSPWSVALVKPVANTTWSMPDGSAWRVLGGWRTPFLMYAPLGQPQDLVSLGVFDAGWQISALVLDRLNQLVDGQGRPAEIILVHQDGSEEVLAEVTSADPARLTVTVPERGEVQLRTHDSTVWWTQCQPPPCNGWRLTDITCDDLDSSGNLKTKTATFRLDAAETVTCTFGNVQEATLLVEMQTVPDGDPTMFAFTGDATGSIWDGRWLRRSGLLPGTYTVRETVPDGWELLSIECDDIDSLGEAELASATFTLDAGETAKCTFTNRRPGKIVVEKQTLPNGNPTRFSFSGDVTGTIGDGQQIEIGGLEPGVYSFQEQVPSGWQLDSVVCSDPSGDSSGDVATGGATVAVGWGETVKCTFTNLKLGTLIVEKQTAPDGELIAAEFSGDAAGTIGDGGQIVVGNLVPGSYTVSEAVVAGWPLTSIRCTDPTANSNGNLATRTATFRVSAGETVKCIFTNSKLGKIVIEKQTLPDGAPAIFSFSGHASGRLADGQQISVLDVRPGRYTSTEATLAGWDLNSVICIDPTKDSAGSVSTRTATLRVGAGETVQCTFTNRQRGTLIVEKQTLPEGDPTGFTFSGTVAGTLTDGRQLKRLNMPAGIYTSTEAAKAGWGLTSIVCEDPTGDSAGDLSLRRATFRLGPGETVKCTFANIRR